MKEYIAHNDDNGEGGKNRAYNDEQHQIRIEQGGEESSHNEHL